MHKKLKIMLMTFTLIFSISACHEVKPLVVGKLAPSLAVKNGEGGLVDFADFKGKPILLEFWSLSCGVCKASIPILNKIHQQNKDLIIISVATDLEFDHLNDYAKENGIQYLLSSDQLGITEESYKIIGFPTFFFINREHVLERIMQGLSVGENWPVDVKSWVNNQY